MRLQRRNARLRRLRPERHAERAGGSCPGHRRGVHEAKLRAGESAELRLATDARLLRLQVFAYQSPGRPSEQDVKTSSLAMTGPIRVDWRAHRDRPALLRGRARR